VRAPAQNPPRPPPRPPPDKSSATPAFRASLGAACAGGRRGGRGKIGPPRGSGRGGRWGTPDTPSPYRPDQARRNVVPMRPYRRQKIRSLRA
jgi:hypothetical protein